MKNVLIWAANLVGAFGKLQRWLQGKKTYLVNLIIVCTSLGIMLTTAGTGFTVLGDILGKVVQFADGALSFPDMQTAIQQIAIAHAGLLAVFGAAWAAMLQAIQNMTKYAQSVRASKEIKAVLLPPGDAK